MILVTVERLKDGTFKFISSSLGNDEAKKLDRLLTGNGCEIVRLNSVPKVVDGKKQSVQHAKLRNFYKTGGG